MNARRGSNPQFDSRAMAPAQRALVRAPAPAQPLPAHAHNPIRAALVGAIRRNLVGSGGGAAQLVITQGASVGAPSKALLGSLGGGSTTLSNASNTGVVRWTYSMLDVPVGSSVPVGTLSDGGTSTATFTHDVAGNYQVQVQVWGPTSGTLIGADTHSLIVPNARGWILPSFLETNVTLNQAGNVTGWKSALNTFFNDIFGAVLFRDTSLGAATGQALTWTGAAWAPGSAAGFAIVSVSNASSPVAAVAGRQYNVDVSGGPVVINLPTLATNAGVKVKHVKGSLSTNNLTINAPGGGVQLDQRPPFNGQTTTAIVWGSDQLYGSEATFWNYGVTNVYSLE